MATKIETTRFTTATSTGTQDITIAGFGTPQAAIFVWNGNNITADGVADHAIIGIGCTDGTRQWNMGVTDENGVATTDTGRRVDDDRCVWIHDENTVAKAAAEFSAWITDGIRLNWSFNILGTGVSVTAILIGGATNVYAGFAQLHSTVDSATDVTDPGFEPSMVLGANVGRGDMDSADNWAILSLGCGINDGSDTQRCIAWHSVYAAATSQVSALTFSNRISAQLTNDAVTYSVEIDDFDANGFSLISRGAGAGGDYMAYFAMETEKSVWCGSKDSPTSTGNQAVTGVGFQPDFVMLVESMCQAEDAIETDGDGGVFGISVFDGTSEYCHAIASEDGQGTTDTESGHDDIAVYLNKHDGTAGFDATYVSMDSDGWTLNFSAADGTARKWIGVAIGVTAGGGNAPTGTIYGPLMGPLGGPV